MKSKFSIIVPCYNQVKFIYDCYISIVAQNYYNWEIVFVNDGSTDNTLQTLNRIQQFDNRVIILNKENGGLSSARNAGLTKLTGNYVIFLDCDDMLLPNCLSSINKTIEDKQDIDIIQFGYRHISENGFSTYTNVFPSLVKKMQPNILFNNLGPVHSFCISIHIVNKNGLFDETIKSCEDWDYWIRASYQTTKIETINIVLVDYRMNNNSMSRDSFTLYNALKTVALKGKELSNNTSLSKAEVEFNFNNSLKQKLALCLGVSIMQNKIDDAVRLYQQESKIFNLIFEPIDFKAMSSYLTFRYIQTQQEVETILKDVKPKYISFFKEIDISKTQANKALWLIFGSHTFTNLQNKFGPIGTLLFKVKSKFF